MLKLLLKMRRIKREMEMFIFNSAFGQYEEYLLKKEAVSYERLKRKTGRLNRNNFISDNIKIPPCRDDLKKRTRFRQGFDNLLSLLFRGVYKKGKEAKRKICSNSVNKILFYKEVRYEKL